MLAWANAEAQPPSAQEAARPGAHLGELGDPCAWVHPLELKKILH